MSPEWKHCYYSFNRKWAHNEQVGSMRNGSGDEFFALFNRAGCFIKGFAYEYPMSRYRSQPPEIWASILDGVPDDFSSVVNEPAFSMNDITFCIWRRHGDDSWSHGSIDFPDGDDPDGSEYLLEILDGDAKRCQQLAEEYYESTILRDAVRHVYSHLTLTDNIVTSLNPDATVRELAEDLTEIGLPSEKAK